MAKPSSKAIAAAQELKLKANQAYGSQRFTEAIRLYTDAHTLVPSDPIYLSNRAAAFFETGDYAASLADDSKALALLQAREKSEDSLGADLAKGLQLQEKVLNRMRRAALQRKDWGSCIASCRQLDVVETRLERAPEDRLGKKTCQLFQTLGLGLPLSSTLTSEHGVPVASSEAVDLAIKGLGAMRLGASESLPIVRQPLSSDFAYFPVGHEQPDGLIRMPGAVPKDGIPPIPVSELAEGGEGGEWPGKLSLRLLFGASGDPRHVMQSFLELESHLSERPVAKSGTEGRKKPSSGRKRRGAAAASGAQMWAGVELLCDMNDLDTRVLARNVLFLVMLRGMGTGPPAGGSQDGGAVLDKVRWQLRFAEAMEKGRAVDGIVRQWMDLFPGQQPRTFFKGTHFLEQDLASGELLYKVWLSGNLTASESEALSHALNALVSASTSLAAWQSDPQYSWIAFQSQEDLAAVRKLWQVWADFGWTMGKEVVRDKVRQMVVAVKGCQQKQTGLGQDSWTAEAARVEMDSWRRTGVTASAADVKRGLTRLGGMAINPTMLHEVTPFGSVVEKPFRDHGWNNGPHDLISSGGGYLGLMDQLELGIVGATCLQLFIWAQALSRLFSRGAQVRVRVLPGSICNLGAMGPERDEQVPGSSDGARPTSLRYHRIHTTNIIDYIGALNLLTTVGTQLDHGCPHALLKANVILMLSRYLPHGPPFELGLWLREELLLSNKDLADHLGYATKTSPDVIAELEGFVPTKDRGLHLAGSPKLATWLESTLSRIKLPPLSMDPRNNPSPFAMVLEPRGHTLVTFLNLLSCLVAQKRVTPHWVAERVENLLKNKDELWLTELQVAISLSLMSLPFFPGSPTLLPRGSLSKHTLAVPLLPSARGAYNPCHPQLALVVIIPKGEPGERESYKLLAQAYGEGLRGQLVKLRSAVHLFSSFFVSRADDQSVSKVSLWLPNRWVVEGTGRALLMRIDTYAFVSDWMDIRAD